MVDGGRPAVFITRQAPVSSCRRRGPIEGGGSGVARSGSYLPGTKRRHVTPLMARTEPSPVSDDAGKLADWPGPAAHGLGQRCVNWGGRPGRAGNDFVIARAVARPLRSLNKSLRRALLQD